MYLLMIDYSLITTKELQEILEKVSPGALVVNCLTVDSLLGASEKMDPEFIIFDIGMAGDNPSELYSSLRQINEKAYIIAISAPDIDDALYNAIENGIVDDYMFKPVNKKDFVARFTIALRKKDTPAAKTGELIDQEKELVVDPLAIDEYAQETSEKTFDLYANLSEDDYKIGDQPAPESDEFLQADQLVDASVPALETEQDEKPVESFSDKDFDPPQQEIAQDDSSSDAPAAQEEQEIVEESDFGWETPTAQEEEKVGEEGDSDWDMQAVEEEPKIVEEGDSGWDTPAAQEDSQAASEDSLWEEPAVQEDLPQSDETDTGWMDIKFSEEEAAPDDAIIEEETSFKPEAEHQQAPEKKEAAPDIAVFKPAKPAEQHITPGHEEAFDQDLFGDLQKPAPDKIAPEKVEPYTEDVSSMPQATGDASLPEEDPFKIFEETAMDEPQSPVPGKIEDFEGLFESDPAPAQEKQIKKSEPSAYEPRRGRPEKTKPLFNIEVGQSEAEKYFPGLSDEEPPETSSESPEDDGFNRALLEEFEGSADDDEQHSRAKRHEQSRSGLARAATCAGNIFFALLLIMMVTLSFFLIQSRVTGNVPNVFGYQMYIVLSGSMSPEFDTGSLAFLREIEPEEITAGDIITYRSQAGSDSLTTHRVVEVLNGDNLRFITRGDANNVNDPNPVLAENIVGRVTGAVPYLGYVMDFAQTRQGLILLIFVPGVLIIVFELSKILKYLTQGENGKTGKNTRQPSQIDN